MGEDDGDDETIGAEHFLPARRSLEALREAARGCRGCGLYRRATQTVFGSGSRAARIVMIGEQPGDEEDRRGAPFVGPAGRMLDAALAAAGIARDEVYVTNVVKHFKWEPRGPRRLHKKPNAREIRACMPWLEQEIAAIRPLVVVCLGATAAQALLGPGFRVSRQRGQVIAREFAPHVVATIHPAAILRQPTDEDRRREQAKFVADLKIVAGLLRDR
ncbi:MAG TPA: UdgX family uracil-DNA binding protein [Nannocystis sp.]